MKLKLDNRIPNHDCIFTCFDTESAEQYIGKQGYFTSCYSNFANINNLAKDTLTKISDKPVDGKYYVTNVGEEMYYSFFLPEDLLKTEEKVFRPYTLDEFQKIFMAGQPIRFRHKENKLERLLVLIGYETLSNGNVFIQIGNYDFCLEDLFEEYEWQSPDTEEFKPFGVEE